MHRRVWRLAAPMILSNLSIPLLGIVDTAVMGHLPEPYYIGAVAIGALIFSFIYWGFGFLRMGTTGLTAQAVGAEDSSECVAILGRALLIGVVFSLVLISLQTVIAGFAFYIIDASPDVEANAAVYFDVRIWSAPAVLSSYALVGWFLGTQNAKGAMWILLATNLVNIVLDIAFVVWLGWGISGVAVASVIAEYAGVGVGVFIAFKHLRGAVHFFCWHNILKASELQKMVAVNRNIFIRTLCLIFTFAFFTAQGAKQGDVILAANAILMNFQTFMAYGLDGFAHAAEALVGKAIGARNRQAFWHAAKICGLWSFAVAALFVGIYALAGPLIVALITNIEAVRLTAYEYLPWAILSPLVSVWSFLLDGIYIGATRSVEMRNTMLVATFLFFLPAWYFFGFLDNHGLWLAFITYMAARGVGMALVLYSLDRKGRFLGIS